MKRTKRLLAFLLAFVLVFGSLSSSTMTAVAETDNETAEMEDNDPSADEEALTEEASSVEGGGQKRDRGV